MGNGQLKKKCKVHAPEMTPADRQEQPPSLDVSDIAHLIGGGPSPVSREDHAPEGRSIPGLAEGGKSPEEAAPLAPGGGGDGDGDKPVKSEKHSMDDPTCSPTVFDDKEDSQFLGEQEEQRAGIEATGGGKRLRTS